MKRMELPTSAGIVAAIVALLTLGFSSYAQAQAPPDPITITDCAGLIPNSMWTGFCTPIWKLPIGNPELAFGPPPNGTITYSGHTMMIDADVHSSIWYAGNFIDPSAAAHVAIRVDVDATGALVPATHDACGDASTGGFFADFCVTGTTQDPTDLKSYSGVLVRGIIKHFDNKPHAVQPAGNVPLDDFEFDISVDHSINPGTFYNDFFFTTGFNEIALEAFGYNDGSTVYVGDNPFGSNFTEYYVSGYSGPTIPPLGFTFGSCTGQISGSVTDYFNPLNGIPGAEVSMTGQPNVPTSSVGAYASVHTLCQGTYTVAPTGFTNYAVYGPDPRTVTLTSDNDVTSGSGINFRLYSVPAATTFTTYNQGAWGTRAKAQNTGQFLATWFSLVYPSGLEVGLTGATGFSIIETTPVAVADILPQEGKPVRLTADYTDPAALLRKANKARYSHHRKLGSLAGEMMALELNVDFSKFSLTRNGLGGLHLASGALAGQTVDQVLALGNKVLGGGLVLPNAAWPTLKTYDTLEDVIEAINRNYQAGTIDRHYLIP